MAVRFSSTARIGTGQFCETEFSQMGKTGKHARKLFSNESASVRFYHMVVAMS